ncbi:uncharacterized protein MONOS_1235 [Monocercomonoides exilis]|uniref:uncharacterized protein n=1 Tax=Monocercomonoides exilis TaxID=2049356 RepID=UPI00355A2071|nr:hypothetical protein MONOS_1235 [Monocercomonoides exilis]|eukprot:MONOS_1235.1-p1 / transcript=MONOS_1235.1 / gene=MONOS_1235 / organism=Monocercomonoides_exilis_PA203 / gene_product=unspecified product / transcript_product=unspecified product / location=Mono_scaffold00021:69621-70433(-) / protein_length=221 / sequence_SO=supercontig / SO=protein_coding / is_pseudo=false
MSEQPVLDVEKSLDEMINEKRQQQRLYRGKQQRDRGSSFSLRRAQVSRSARLEQLRGQTRTRKPKTQRNFGAAGILKAPVRVPMMAPVVQPAPSVLVLPVAPHARKGGRSQSVLTKAQRRALTQELTKITRSTAPVQFPAQFAAPVAPKVISTYRPAHAQRKSKLVQRPPAQPMMMIPPPQPTMTPPMYLVPAPSGSSRMRTRRPIRNQPRSKPRSRGTY